MNPDQPRTPREELELRVTSLLLGELPAAEAAAVREAIAKDPELAKLHDDLKQTIHLVRVATTVEPATTAPETTRTPDPREDHRCSSGSPSSTAERPRCG